MIELRAFNIGFKRSTTKLFDPALNVRFEPGRFYVFRQSNGSGKSSLFRAIAGVSFGDRDSVDYDGELVVERNTLVFLDQHAQEHLNARLSLRENIAQLLGRKQSLFSLRSNRDVYGIGLRPDQLNVHADVASGGGRLYALVSAILSLSDITTFVLDEPFASLDTQRRALVWDQLENRRRTGACILIAAHDQTVPGNCNVNCVEYVDWKLR